MLVTEEWGLSQALRYLAAAFGLGNLRALLVHRCGRLGCKCVETAEEGGAAVDATWGWYARLVIDGD